MKAILLAGGKGTRLRPLTLHTPKPIVPIFDRPFLSYQLDRLRQVPEITEVVLSLNYQPRRIEETFGGEAQGLRIGYAVEPSPLGTGGAIKFAAQRTSETVVVFNGDVLTAIDLAAVIRVHRERRAKATIVLTPVENPSAYGLVTTSPDGLVERFIEKPSGEDLTCHTINAGIYVLEPETFDRIPDGEPYSIERSYFPSLIERRETFAAYVHEGYWIDIGTPEKYQQVHRDIMDARFNAAPFGDGANGDRVWAAHATVEEGARLEGPCFLDEGVVVKTGARVGPYTVLGRHCHVESGAEVSDSIVWSSSWIGSDATVHGTLAGRNCHIGRSVRVRPGAVLGDKSVATDFTQI